MKLTTKGRYAVTAMLDLAMNSASTSEGGEGAVRVTLGEIAERQGISLSYLEQLFGRLRRRGLVSSTRGPGGGYQLAFPASEIAVADVISAVDEMVDATRCGGAENCMGEERCLTHDLWEDLSRQIREFLSDISLAELVERRQTRADLRLSQDVASPGSAPAAGREAPAAGREAPAAGREAPAAGREAPGP